MLGGKNLRKHFSKVKWAKKSAFSPGNKVLSINFKKNVSELAELLLEYQPMQMQMRRITIIDQARARNDFIFTNIKENTGLRKKLFEFKMPLNAEMYSVQ